MRAAVCFETHRAVRVEDVSLDPPRADEVLVRIAAAGVCHSDWGGGGRGLILFPGR